MNNLQLATTLVAPTGTGLLYVPMGGDPQDSVGYINSSGATRSILTLKRTQPKPTSTFPGVHRLELKRLAYFTVGEVEYVAVASVVTSIPVPIVLADRTSVFTNLALLARDDILKNAIETGVIPS